MKTAIILGSSRSDGATQEIVHHIISQAGWDLKDLKDHTISYYDYEHRNRDDDFLPLMQDLIQNYDTLVFATPVYWYSMSGIMKVFFDRLSDLLTIEKELGRALKGKNMAVLSCSNGNNLGPSFFLPFEHTARYLEMNLVATRHFINGKSREEDLRSFIQIIEKGPDRTTSAPRFTIKNLDHVAIRVNDLEHSAHWYEQTLGLKRYAFSEWGPFPIFMMAGRSGVALFPKRKNSEIEEEEASRKCNDHFAFYTDPEEYEKAKACFEQNKMDYSEQDHYFFRSIYTKDPDGHTVELTTLNPGKEYFYEGPPGSAK